MRARIKSFHSPDIADLWKHQPADEESFCFLLQLMVGPESGEGEESFELEICTPAWLLQNRGSEEVVLGWHRAIVFRYDFPGLARHLQRVCARITGETWAEVAGKLARLARWEFEDYRP